MKKKKVDAYKQDGVDIVAGDFFSKFCGDICRETYGISPFVEMYDLSMGNFRGPRGYILKNLPDGCIETGGMDGIGTKVVLIDAMRGYAETAFNLIAMTAMDITRWGGLPLAFMNIFDVRSLGEVGSERFRSCQLVMLGLRQIALKEKYVLLTGECAELGLCVGSENEQAGVMFNWGGAMLGVYHPEKIINGSTLRPGQRIVVLRDNFRSNGISSVRKALAMQYGPNYWNNPDALKDIFDASSPSTLYDRMLNDAHGWFNPPDFKPKIKMRLVIRLSGGAWESKFGNDILEPMGLSAQVDDLFDPSPIMRKCAKWRGMSGEECYRTWNGGQGAAVVVDEKDVKKFIGLCGIYGIEAKEAGIIMEKQKYTVEIYSKFGKEVIRY